MTEQNSRRAILALMSRECFAYVMDATRHRPKGEPVPSGSGFTADEVNRAKRDRKAIGERYTELKRTRPFWESEVTARMEFLTGLEDDQTRAARTPDAPGDRLEATRRAMVSAALGLKPLPSEMSAAADTD